MRRIVFVLVLAALGCGSGEQSAPTTAEQAAPAPAASPAAPEAAPAAPAAPAAVGAVGETVTLPSGVQITHRTIGTGANPTATDKVSVHYVGTFPDGKEFDSGDASFPLNGVIACWTEGVQMIKEGGKAQLICPPQTAYGERGMPPVIPPNATLHFEVELTKVL